MASPIKPYSPFVPVIQKRLGGDEFAVEGEFGKGAVWRVFKSKCLSTNGYVAIKEASTADVRQEIDILTRCIGREHIVQLIKACRDETDRNKALLFTYLITELCSTDLTSFLRDLGGRLPVGQLRTAAKHLVDGYVVLYSNGILHKNISSKNILVYFVGNTATLKISGFNCSVILDKPNLVKRLLTITGRAQYMAPEIGRSFVKSKRSSTEYSPKSDLWSLGVLFYEMALGKFPFTSSTLLQLFKARQPKDSPVDFEFLDSAESIYCGLIRKLLRVNVDQRATPQSLCIDDCLRNLAADKIFISNDQMNEALRIYDLSWTLSAAVAATRVRDYEYNETSEIGKGSFGKVWQAKRTTDGARVALKRLYIEDVDLEEIRTMETVVHPNLLRLIDHFEQFPYMYIITELCSFDLCVFITTKFPNHKLRNEQDAKILAKHLSAGYMAMKSAEILHRDIKPTNVLVSIDTDGGAFFKLADFGCSKTMTHAEYAQTVLGTPFYMAPELGACLYLQINTAHYDHRADIWSMALIVFQSLVGRLPFEEGDLLRLCYDVGTGNSTEYYQANLQQQTEAVDASEDLRDLLIRSLCADYTRRMTAADFFQHRFHSHLPLNTRLRFSA